MKKRPKWLRLTVLLTILVYVTIEAYLHQVLGGGKAASVHALCPFGALESLYSLLFMGTFIQKIYSGTVVLLIVTVGIAVLFRRSFCGMLCPFGALQEFIAMLGQKIFRRRHVVPPVIDKPARYLKYGVLLLTMGMAWYYGKLWISPYDPYVAWGHLSAIEATLAEEPLSVIGFVLLAVTIAGSFLYDRFFCKYLCPVGAFYGIIGRLSPTRVERNEDICVHCHACNKACPVNINVEQAVKIDSLECINCNDCVVACPKKGALTIRSFKHKLQPTVILAIVVCLFFGTILISDAAGYYQTVPEPLKKGETIPLSEVKGYYTIAETAAATGLTLPEVYRKMGILESVPENTQMKEISNLVPDYSFDEAKQQSTTTNTQDPASTPVSNKTAAPIDVSEIKGFMTIREAADILKMDLKQFYTLFRIPETVPVQTQLKNIQQLVPGYSLDEVKASLD